MLAEKKAEEECKAYFQEQATDEGKEEVNFDEISDELQECIDVEKKKHMK